MNASFASRRGRWARTPPALRARLSRALVVALPILVATACSPPGEAELRTPRLVGDAAALERVLARAEQIHGTPIAREARALRAKIADCEAVAALADVEAPHSLLEDLHCIPSSELAAAAGPHPLDGEALLVWPLGEDGYARAELDIDAAGSVTASIDLSPPSDPGWLALLIPGEQAPGPPDFDSNGALLHARMRPAEMPDLSGLAALGKGLRAGQGDPIDALKQQFASKIAAAVFEGTWELAVYPSAEAGGPPLFVVSLEHRRRSLAEQAIAGVVAELERSWPVRHTARRFRDARGEEKGGACFDDLNLLPGFTPCWIVDDERVVIGWNAYVIDRALAGTAPARGDENRAVLHLDRIARADAGGATGLPADHPAAAWRRVELETRAEAGHHVRVDVRLRASQVQS